MVRCEGKDQCRKIHVPYVDTHIQRTRDQGQARVSDKFGKFLTCDIKDILYQDGFKTVRILDPPNTPIISEQPCQQNADGDCLVKVDNAIDQSI